MKKEPLELLETKSDWEKDIATFVAVNGYSLCQKSVNNGHFEYIVADSEGNKIVTIRTKRNINFGSRRSRVRKRR